MQLFETELVTKIFAQLFPDNSLNVFMKVFPEQLTLEEKTKVEISEVSHTSTYQNVEEGKFMFFHEKFPKSSKFYCMELCLYSPITDIVEAMKILIQKRQQSY